MLLEEKPSLSRRAQPAVLASPGASRYDGSPAEGLRARSSAEEHYLDMVGVTGSIPVAPTINRSEKFDEAVGDLRKAGADAVDPSS